MCGSNNLVRVCQFWYDASERVADVSARRICKTHCIDVSGSPDTVDDSVTQESHTIQRACRD